MAVAMSRRVSVAFGKTLPPIFVKVRSIFCHAPITSSAIPVVFCKLDAYHLIVSDVSHTALFVDFNTASN